MSSKVVIGIVATLVTMGVGGSWGFYAQAQRADEKISTLETRVAKHEAAFERIVPMLERIDERVGEIRRRVERLEDLADHPQKTRK